MPEKLMLYKPVYQNENGTRYIPFHAEWRSQDSMKFKDLGGKRVGWVTQDFNFVREVSDENRD